MTVSRIVIAEQQSLDSIESPTLYFTDYKRDNNIRKSERQSNESHESAERIERLFEAVIGVPLIGLYQQRL